MCYIITQICHVNCKMSAVFNCSIFLCDLLNICKRISLFFLKVCHIACDGLCSANFVFNCNFIVTIYCFYAEISNSRQNFVPWTCMLFICRQMDYMLLNCFISCFVAKKKNNKVSSLL